MKQRGPALQELLNNWSLLLGTTLGCLISSSGFLFYTSSIFFSELHKSLGWSLKELTSVPLAFMLTTAVVMPFTGAAIDRFGTRMLIAGSFAGVTLCYLVLGVAPASFPLYISMHVAIGGLGTAASSVGFTRIISARFDHARGFAIGVTIAGLGAAATVGPILVSSAVGNFGWRAGYLTLAAVVAVFGPLVLLLIGKEPNFSHRPVKSDVPESLMPFLTLIKSRVFWILVAAFTPALLFGTGYIFLLVEILKSRGADLALATKMTSVLGVGLLVGRLLSGWLIDRVFAPWVGSSVFVIFAFGLALVIAAPLAWSFLAAACIGCAFGSEIDIASYLVSRYFGASNYGRAYGLIFSINSVCSGGSALLISTLVGSHQNYSLAVWTSVVFILGSASILLLLPRYDQASTNAPPPCGAASHRRISAAHPAKG